VPEHTNNPSNAPIDELPSEGQLYDLIFLMNSTVWGRRLTYIDIENWLSNFQSDVFDIAYERRMALLLLANFVYYNEDEVRHLCRQMYRNFIHESLLKSSLTEDPSMAVKSILGKTQFGELGPPGKSGSVILYYFRHENALQESNIFNTANPIPDHVDTIVYIDDVTVSGDQARTFLLDENDNLLIQDKHIKILTLIATKEATHDLGSIGIQVTSCIDLDDRSKCFSANSSIFHYFPNHLDNCRQFATIYGLKANPADPLGHSNGQYSFGFFYNVPDNTLPIFWSQHAGWKPVMPRYISNAVGGTQNEIGPYI